MLPPLFVLGCPRSGTTLVASLLEPTAWGKPVETHFITKYDRRLERYGDLSQREAFERLAGEILRERPVLQWRLRLGAADLWRAAERPDFRGLVDALMLARAGVEGRRAWGDKTPSYILELERIERLFPDSKVVYVVRDGRDVALSLLGRRWGPNNAWACGAYWASCNRPRPVIERLRRSGRWHALRYETLLGQPREEIERLYRFLDQPLEPADLDRMAGSVRGSNFDKWRQAMSAADLRRFEEPAAGELRRLGYEPAADGRSLWPGARGFWRAHDRLCRAIELVRSNTIDFVKIRYFGGEPFAE